MMIAQYKRKTKDHWYDFFSKLDHRKALLEALRSPAIDLILDHAKPADVILEGGCSTGRFLESLRLLGYSNVHGFEIEPRLVKIAKAQKHDVKQGSVLSMPYEDGFADIYLELGVMEHFTPVEQERILSEIRRVLKRKGKIILSVAYINPLRFLLSPYIALKNHIYRMRGYPFHQWMYSKGAVCLLLEASGFRPVKFNQSGPRALIVAEKD